MNQPAKYMFDNPFDTNVDPVEQEEAEREAERQRSFEDGYRAGEEDALNKLEADILGSIETLISGYKQANVDFDSDLQKARNEAVEIAVAVAKKLSGKLVEQYPLDELAAFLEKTVQEIGQEVGQETNLIVRVAETLVSDVEARIGIVQASSSIPTRITVEGSKRIAPGAGQVEWRDGSISRAPEIMSDMVDDAVSKFLSSRLETVSSSQPEKEDMRGTEIPTDKPDVQPLDENMAVNENMDAASVTDSTAAKIEAVPEAASAGGHHE